MDRIGFLVTGGLVLIGVPSVPSDHHAGGGGNDNGDAGRTGGGAVLTGKIGQGACSLGRGG